ncbi:hypothetical protein DFA_09037 [Cavenderia fasciculata]|uniref:RBR-type E3 ubiquitin transferase n=1 Tax=Cavenderia fasciculata TaxID=261658 RepID=F4Q6I9_CACFS|nr:uncharacterized protein DFA_09037 [Cavenderia fasciculata]EGG16499.1 hypothetical protein DFA_09037 [Cavenderia fasciculata]|eukprot:XP_004354899.1 hypothetical protein DFA_09037 [Cavenderia fasciculata]
MEDLISQLQDLFPSLSIDKATTVLKNHNNDVEASINHLLTSSHDGDSNDDNAANIQDIGQQFKDELKREEQENERLLLELLNKENDETNSQVNEKKQHTCSICYCDNLIGEFYIMDECEHRFCLDCVKQNYEYQINSGFPNVKCPQTTCKKIISYDEAKQILSDNKPLFEKYDQLLLKVHIEKDVNVRYCSFPDCKNAMIIHPGATDIICLEDGYSTCLKCREPSHYEMTCEEWVEVKEYLSNLTVVDDGQDKPLKHYVPSPSRRVRPFWMNRRWISTEHWTTQKALDKLTREFIRYNTRTCPTCNLIIEKNGGCHDMTCVCGQRFCYGCGQDRSKHEDRYPCHHTVNIF